MLQVKCFVEKSPCFMPPRSKIGGWGGDIVFVQSVILSFCPPLWNLNIDNYFWTASARAFIFHMNIPEGTIIFYSVTLTLEFDPFFKYFNLANKFRTVSARSFIFHMSIPCDKTYPWVALFLTLLAWPWSFSINIRVFILHRAFLVTRSSYWYQDICPCDLDHLLNWPLSGAYVFPNHILFLHNIQCLKKP